MSEKLDQELKFSRIIARYGGWKAIYESRYFHLAVILLFPTYSLWSKPNWWDTVLAILPNLLGFTIGAFALILAFGDEKFKNILAKEAEEGKGSPIHQMSATFFIFIAVQTISLLGALACKGMWEYETPFIPAKYYQLFQYIGLVVWFINYLFFIYGILLALAAAKWIHMLAISYATYLNSNNKK